MPLEPGSFLLLILLGGAVAIDGTSFGQFMVSRPFVAAALAGWIAGDPVAGAAIGIVLEAFHLTVLPVGAARYPEGGPAAVAGGAVYATSDGAMSTLILTVLFVLLLEWIGGESVRYLRQVNVRLVTVDHRPQVNARTLESRHRSAIALDFARGALLAAAGTLVIGVAIRLLVPYWGLGEAIPRLVLVAVVAGLFTSTLKLVGWRRWFTLAGAIGAVALLAATT